MDILKNSEDVKETVKREIEAIIFKDDEYNLQVIKANIRKHEKELDMLRNIIKGTDDRELRPPSKNRHKKASKNEMNRSISLIF